MKINGLQPQEVYKSFMKDVVHTGSAHVKASRVSQTDSLEVSSQCAELNEARKLADESGIVDLDGGVREEKIEELKSLIEQGQYNVSAKDVAESIIKGKFLDSKA